MADATTSNLFKRESKSHFEKRLQNLNQIKKLTKRQKEWLQAEYKLHNRLAAAEKRGFVLNEEELLMQGRTLDASGMSHIPMPKRVTKKDIEALNSLKGTKALLEISDYVSLDAVTSGKIKLPKTSKLYMMELNQDVALPEGQATPIVLTVHPDYLDAVEIGPVTREDREFIAKEAEESARLLKGNVATLKEPINVEEFHTLYPEYDYTDEESFEEPSPQETFYKEHPEAEFDNTEVIQEGKAILDNIYHELNIAPTHWNDADRYRNYNLEIKQEARDELARMIEMAINTYGENIVCMRLAYKGAESVNQAIRLVLYAVYEGRADKTENLTDGALEEVKSILSDGDFSFSIRYDFGDKEDI